MHPDDLHRAQLELRDRLVRDGLLIPTGVDGLYGRNGVFEHVLRAVDDQARALGRTDEPESVEFPPFVPKQTFDRIGYLGAFPQLAGTVYSFDGGDREHAALMQQLESGESYSASLGQTEIALVPACCHPVYPAATGSLPDGGRVFELSSYCFRHEPSVDPMRMIAFRQREHVRLGTSDQTAEWRERWFERTPTFFAELGLDVAVDVANDAFFGRAGRLMASAQLEQELKFEFRIPVYSDEDATACASVNNHQDHFGHMFDIRADDGGDAQSSCIGFGLERCTVALFARHGTDVDAWPCSVRSRLWP